MLPEKFGNTPLKRIVYIYTIIWDCLYGFKPTIQWGIVGKLLKPLYTEYSEIQVAALVCLHFTWHGSTGEDNFTFKILQDKCFPLEWIPKSANAYRAYITNSLGIDWDNQQEMQDFVINSVKHYAK